MGDIGAALRARPDCTGKIGATGFCYGGGVSNMLAARLGADIQAVAPFYGAVPTPEEIKKDTVPAPIQESAEGPIYPWGLCLNLSEEELAKLKGQQR